MLQCKDYEKYLSEIGTGPLSRVMVMRASVVVNITQVLTSVSKLNIMKVPVLSRHCICLASREKRIRRFLMSTA